MTSRRSSLSVVVVALLLEVVFVFAFAFAFALAFAFVLVLVLLVFVFDPALLLEPLPSPLPALVASLLFSPRLGMMTFSSQPATQH
jgi:hypothetical protein